MTTKEKIKVMQAFIDGKQIQCMPKNGTDWHNVIVPDPTWDWERWDFRVKPELEYISYKNTDEMVKDYLERFGIVRTNYEMPSIWVAIKNLSKNENITVDAKRMIISFGNESILMANGVGGVDTWRMDELFKFCTYLDGSPVGKLVK